MFNRIRWSGPILVGLLALPFVVGCGAAAWAPLPDRPQRLTQGYVYYLDGAGGGDAQENYGSGVRQGLLAAGFTSASEMFDWNTDMGALVDQVSSVQYKRGKAAELARKIQAYRQQYPHAPISLIGLSAGTAVVVYTLEALPADCPVDNVVLLGASISDNYDLTEALQHVRNKLFIITSEQDAVLKFLVPSTGTADREFGDPAAGRKGFVMPAGATAGTQRLYTERLVTIPWIEQFERDGNYGGHLGNVKKDFVRDYVAPLVMEGKPRAKRTAVQ
jgi:pimeloyl-ACP methyl ester carboxylesterase